MRACQIRRLATGGVASLPQVEIDQKACGLGELARQRVLVRFGARSPRRAFLLLHMVQLVGLRGRIKDSGSCLRRQQAPPFEVRY
jgi:hypothetical protein